jgi:hypothetical protein
MVSKCTVMYIVTVCAVRRACLIFWTAVTSNCAIPYEKHWNEKQIAWLLTIGGVITKTLISVLVLCWLHRISVWPTGTGIDWRSIV